MKFEQNGDCVGLVAAFLFFLSVFFQLPFNLCDLPWISAHSSFLTLRTQLSFYIYTRNLYD